MPDSDSRQLSSISGEEASAVIVQPIRTFLTIFQHEHLPLLLGKIYGNLIDGHKIVTGYVIGKGKPSE